MDTMRLLVDENVRERLLRWLVTDLKYDVERAGKGVKNSTLFTLACASRRILLTNDTDFLNTALYPPQDTPGRIVLRVFPDTLEHQQKSLEMLFSQVNTKKCAGKLIELELEHFETHTK